MFLRIFWTQKSTQASTQQTQPDARNAKAKTQIRTVILISAFLRFCKLKTACVLVLRALRLLTTMPNAGIIRIT